MCHSIDTHTHNSTHKNYELLVRNIADDRRGVGSIRISRILNFIREIFNKTC